MRSVYFKKFISSLQSHSLIMQINYYSTINASWIKSLFKFAYYVIRDILSNCYPIVFFVLTAGFVLHAGVLQIVLYWLLHLIHLFMKFIFPFAIRRFDTKKWKRIFHITELILINLITVVAPIYIILDSKYYPYGYPPVLCVPNATFTFYALVLPIIVMLCLGTCIILLMFWRLQMVS